MQLNVTGIEPLWLESEDKKSNKEEGAIVRMEAVMTKEELTKFLSKTKEWGVTFKSEKEA